MKPIKAIAACDFRHKNIDYRSGEAVDLGDRELNALSRVGLVDLCVVGSMPSETEPKDNEDAYDEQSSAKDPDPQAQDTENDSDQLADPEPDKPERKGAKK